MYVRPNEKFNQFDGNIKFTIEFFDILSISIMVIQENFETGTKKKSIYIFKCRSTVIFRLIKHFPIFDVVYFRYLYFIKPFNSNKFILFLCLRIKLMNSSVSINCNDNQKRKKEIIIIIYLLNRLI